MKENPELFETAGHTWQSVKSIPFSSFSQSVVTLVTKKVSASWHRLFAKGNDCNDGGNHDCQIKKVSGGNDALWCTQRRY